MPGQQPRDNYSAQEYAERDWQGALGTSDNQSGQVSKKKTTATEARIVAGSYQGGRPVAANLSVWEVSMVIEYYA